MYTLQTAFRLGFLTLVLCIFSYGAAQAQKETYDIVTYTPPPKYQKQQRENCVVYTFMQMKDSTWCQIIIYKNTKSLGDIDKDFDAEWQELVAGPNKITDTVAKEEVGEAEGWKIMSGSARWTFDQKPAATIMTTCSGHEARVSFVVNTNAARYLQDYENLIASIDLYYPGKAVQQAPVPSGGDNTTEIAGVWVKSGSVNPSYGDAASWGAGGSTKDQYIIHPNGTYEFYSKAFSYSNNQLILVRESGQIRMQGNQMTLIPSYSVVESWSKKDNTDQWGARLSSTPRALETTTYTVTKHYFSGIQEWNLILQTPKKTFRDGEFGQNPNFENAYFFSPASNVNNAIILPKE
jgi:hypothetical protein